MCVKNSLNHMVLYYQAFKDFSQLQPIYYYGGYVSTISQMILKQQ